MKRSHKLLSLILTICIAMSMLPGFAPANAVTMMTTTAADSEVFELPDIVDSVEAKENDYDRKSGTGRKRPVYLRVLPTATEQTQCVFTAILSSTLQKTALSVIFLSISRQKHGGGFVTADHEIITTFESKLTEGVSLEYNDIELTLVPALGLGTMPTGRAQHRRQGSSPTK